MSKTIRASVLIVLLACSVRADWMQNGSPAPPPAKAVQEPTNAVTLNGETHTPGLSESLTQITLELLAALPSIL